MDELKKYEFYRDERTTIYCGDSMDILPLLEACDLALTDPPYGVKGAQNTKTRHRGQKNIYSQFIDSPEYVAEKVIPIVHEMLAKASRAVITPGVRCLTMYPMPDSFGCFYQPASVGLQAWGRCDAQPIFYYGSFPGDDSKEIPSRPCSFLLNQGPQANGHPCPKPYTAWRRLLSFASRSSDLVLDPFMGSGTTLKAAKDLGLRAIGIEIEEKYCSIAVERLKQRSFDWDAA